MDELLGVGRERDQRGPIKRDYRELIDEKPSTGTKFKVKKKECLPGKMENRLQGGGGGGGTLFLIKKRGTGKGDEVRI